MQLNKLMEQIDGAFGEDAPFTQEPLGEVEQDTLSRVFGEFGYQRYLQDQISRQVIRDYLANALLLGYLEEGELERFAPQLATCEGRSGLALQMVVASVEQARELYRPGEAEQLTTLQAHPERPSYIRLIRS